MGKNYDLKKRGAATMYEEIIMKSYKLNLEQAREKIKNDRDQRKDFGSYTNSKLFTGLFLYGMGLGLLIIQCVTSFNSSF